MIHKARQSTVERGDAMQVVRMSIARGMRDGRGYSFSYVRRCLKGVYRNEDINAMHDELVALRSPKPRRR